MVGGNPVLEVRQALDGLGYREPLPPDAFPLVQRLFNDLLSCRKDLKETKENLIQTQKRCDDVCASVAPYQEENGRLLTQLNTLHMANITLREQNDKHSKELQNALQKLEEENRNLRLLAGEYQRQKEELEAESSKKNDKILQLQEKNLRAVVTTPGGRRKPIPFQRQRLEITSHLPENNMSSSNKCSKCGCAGGSQSQRNNNNDAYLADLLRMTDQKLLDLQQEVERSQRHAKENENQCATLKKQISNREAEINRLQGLLEGGRTVAAVIEDNRLQAAHAHLHQLQLHNDMLTKTNIHLESKLKNNLGDTHDAMNRAVELADVNTDLTKELHNVENTNRLLEEDVFNTAETLTQRLDHTKTKLLSCKADLAEQHRLYHLMRDERDRLYKELIHVRHDYSKLTHDHTRLVTERMPMLDENKRMEDLLRKGQEEKKTLVDKINRLTVLLQETETDKLRLSVDGESLRQTVIELKAQKDALNKSISELKEEKETAEQGKAFYASETEKLMVQNKEQEQERDYYKEEMLKSQAQKTNMEQERDFYKNQTGELSREKQLVEQSRSYMGDDLAKLQAQFKQMQQERNYFNEQLNQTQGEKRQAEREREYYSEQVIQLLDILKSKPSSTPSTPMQIGRPRPKPISPENEIARLTHERDVLKQERDFYKMQYQSVKSQQAGGSAASIVSGGMGVGPPGTGVGAPSALGPLPMGPATAAPSAGGPTTVGSVSPPPRPQSVPTGAVDVETVRRERDFFKQQMEYFRQQLNLQLSRGAPTAAAPGAVDTDRPQRSPLIRAASEASPLHDVDSATLRNEMRVYQQERDFFRQQYENLKASLAQPLPRAGEEEDISNLVRERDMFHQERDFFRTQYNDISRRIAQITSTTPSVSQTIRQEMEALMSEKRGLSITKADLEAQVRSLTEKLLEAEREKNEIDSHTRELHSAIEKLQDAATQRYPPSTQAFIMEIRKARDAAMGDLDKVKKERDHLREKLREATSHQIREKATLEEEASNLRRQTEEGGRTVTDLQQRLHSQAALIASLQDQVQNLQEALQQAHGELGLQGKQSDEIKKLLNRKVGEMGDAEHQLEFRLNQLSMAQARVKELEAELSRVNEELVDARAEGSTMRNNVSRLDHDKDRLSAELDTKTEHVANLREELRKKEALIATLEGNIMKLEGKLDAALSSIAAEERKLAGEERRGQRLEQDLADIILARDAANKEIRRLQKEITGLTQDYKKLQEDLEKCQVSKDNFKKKAQEYCLALEELTNILSSKDSEQSSLKKQYLNLNEAVSSLKSLNASLEESITSRVEEMTKMEAMVAKFKEEREQIISQMMEASQKCDELEESCRKLEEDKYNVEKELLTTRDLAQKLDMKRGQAEGEVARLNTSLEKVLEQKRSLEQRLDGISCQLNTERSNARSLEEVLNEKRRAEWSSQASNKQLEVEKHQLQRKVTELQEQLEDETNETKRFRTRAAQLESDVERMRRELTDERFERERTTQELRRVRTLLI
ncbi:centrosomal protein of 135 kDa-like isoform X2 [Homarus americanus]|uniref:centrosomal protein of 135 kDa-like isoform X2 n=1 Tax=Homarus americanus TaxID=6706 RepID=UPI001C47542F|nr:centrosomal protein of 135 kDa-like isoform X2 [Homarus americanus]